MNFLRGDLITSLMTIMYMTVTLTFFCVIEKVIPMGKLI